LIHMTISHIPIKLMNHNNQNVHIDKIIKIVQDNIDLSAELYSQVLIQIIYEEKTPEGILVNLLSKKDISLHPH